MKKLSFITLVFLLSACDLVPKDSDLSSDIKDKLSDIQDSIKDYSGKTEEMATDEVEKLFIYEYQIKEFAKDIETEEFTSQLNELGKERWECFHVEKEIELYKVFCRRKPKTYLRYIPRVL